MKKRLIDIYPPPGKRAVLEQEESPIAEAEHHAPNQPQKSLGGRAMALLLLFAFLAPPLFSHLFFAKARVQVWPQITKTHMEEQIEARVGAEKVNLERGIIRARVFEEEKALTQVFPASGKYFKEERARGTIRVYNENSTQPQALVANTRFISQDGKLFRSETAVSIPGGEMDGRKLAPGFLDVRVTAAEPGAAYNIGPSNFSLPGLVGSPLYTKIYAESFGPMTGGAEHEVSAVREDDIRLAKDQLVETLKAQAVKSLLARVPPQFEMLADSLTFAVVEDNSLVKPGAELQQFNASAKIKVSMTGFHKEDADVLARYVLSRHLKPGQAVNEETLQITYRASAGAGGSGFMPLTLQITADQYETIDGPALTRRIAGVSGSEFPDLIEEYPFLARARFSLWPFWVARVPRDPERVQVDVNLHSW